MAFNDKINNNIEEMFSEKQVEPAIEAFKHIVTLAVLDYRPYFQERNVGKEVADRYKPGRFLDRLNEKERNSLKVLTSEQIRDII